MILVLGSGESGVGSALLAKSKGLGRVELVQRY